MVCKKCGYQNSSEAIFCSGCGVKLEKTEKSICKKCGTENEPNAVFCFHCGAKLKNKIPVKTIVSIGIIALIIVIGVFVCTRNIGNKNSAVHIDFNLHYVEEAEMYMAEYGQIDAYDVEGDLLWSYITECYECGQYDSVEELCKTEDRFYFCENGTLVALDSISGEVLWKNSDLDGWGVDCCIGENGTLYLCAFTDPAFMAVDKDGKTLHRIERFDDDYTWAHRIEKDGDNAVITMDFGPDEYRGPEGFVWRVNLKDGSYEMVNELATGDMGTTANHIKETGDRDQIVSSDAENENHMAITEDEFAFGTDIRRDQVKRIIFLDTLHYLPQTARDISEDGDGSVMSWVGVADDLSDREYLYIAAEGKIIAPENCSGLFANYAVLEEICFNDCLDTSKVTDMSDMFSYCVSLQELDLTAFDTSNVTDMRNMFLQDIELEKLDVSSFDTNSVKNMENMFYGCCKLKKLDVSGFNTRHVADMSDMFYSCYSLEILDVSGFETPEVKDMSGMFSTMNINYLDLRGFDFSNVEDASYMFFASEELRDVDINKINLSANANTEMMFEYCPAFQKVEETEAPEYIPAGNWSDVRASVGGTVSCPWVFDEPVKDCKSFTLHYQITDVSYGKINGTYVLYRKTLNNNWERVGKFDVNDQSEVVKTFEFDQPVSFRELAVAAPSGRQFSFSVKMWFDDWEFQN